MAKKVSSPSLKEAFTSHLEETKAHISRLEKITWILDIQLKGKVCHAMKGLVE